MSDADQIFAAVLQPQDGTEDIDKSSTKVEGEEEEQQEPDPEVEVPEDLESQGGAYVPEETKGTFQASALHVLSI